VQPGGDDNVLRGVIRPSGKPAARRRRL